MGWRGFHDGSKFPPLIPKLGPYFDPIEIQHMGGLGVVLSARLQLIKVDPI